MLVLVLVLVELAVLPLPAAVDFLARRVRLPVPELSDSLPIFIELIICCWNDALEAASVVEEDDNDVADADVNERPRLPALPLLLLPPRR